MKFRILLLLAGIALFLSAPANAQVFGPSNGSTCTIATTSVLGCIKPDGTTVTINGAGVISAPTGGSGNVTGVASSTTNDVVVFSSTTGKAIADGGVLVSALATASGMTSGQLGVAGGAKSFTSSVPFGLTGNSTVIETTSGGLLTPSILPLATTGAFGATKGDGSTLTISSGIISCTTATTGQLGCVKPDGTTITISSGTISGAAAANPTATIGTSATNGSATTFMRSDAAPAAPQCAAATFGLCKPDGTTISVSSGVISGTAWTNLPNAGTTGTTQFKLAKLTGAGTVVIATTSDTGGDVLGAVQLGAGTTGSATIATAGIGTCVFDGATTQDHFVQVSTSAGGDCHDTGSTSYPTSGGQVLGMVLSTNATGGNYSMVVFPPAIVPSSGGGSSTFTETTKTTSYTLNSTTDVGVHFDDNGAGSSVPFTLPTGSNGLNYCFAEISGNGMTITAPAAVKIALGTSLSGGAGVLSIPASYDTACLKFVQTLWVVYSSTGGISVQ